MPHILRQFFCTYNNGGGITCAKAFDRNADLKRHITTTHEKAKPFKCNICGKSFAQYSGLKTHENTHTGNRPFICDYCGVSFNDGSSCTRHAKEVHRTTGTFNCKEPGCMRSIKRRCAFVTHLKKDHPEAVYTKEDVDNMAPPLLPRIPKRRKAQAANNGRRMRSTQTPKDAILHGSAEAQVKGISRLPIPIGNALWSKSNSLAAAIPNQYFNQRQAPVDQYNFHYPVEYLRQPNHHFELFDQASYSSSATSSPLFEDVNLPPMIDPQYIGSNPSNVSGGHLFTVPDEFYSPQGSPGISPVRVTGGRTLGEGAHVQKELSTHDIFGDLFRDDLKTTTPQVWV